MNDSILYSSFKYQRSNFELLIKLSITVYGVLCQELYTDDKLLKAFHNKDHTVIKFIIKLVKNRQILNSYLVIYCENKNLEIVKLLLEYGADPQIEENICSEIACRNKLHDILKLLIKYGSDVNNNLLVTCYQYTNIESMKILLDNGAKVDYHVISFYVNNNTMLKILLKYQVNSNDYYDEFINKLGIVTNKQKELFNILLDSGFVVNKKVKLN